MYVATTFILSKKDLKALGDSILFWVETTLEPLSRSGNGRGCKEADGIGFVGNAPLCRLYWHDNCSKCPYMRKHGFTCEDSTSPYAKYSEAPTLKNARAMNKSLESVRT